LSINYSDLLSVCDIPTEHSCLSKIITSKFLPPEITEDMFYYGSNKEVYNAIKNQWVNHSTLDVVLLKNSIAVSLDDILEMTGSYSEQTVSRLRELALQRNFARAVLSFEINPELPASQSISNFQTDISKIALSQKKEYHHSEALSRLITNLEHAQKSNFKLVGYSTGIKKLDNATGGIEKNKVYAIGALKKTGKSRFGVFLSCKLKESGASIFWNTLEMNADQLNLLALSHYSKINSSFFGTYISDYNKVGAAMSNLSDLDWLLYREHTVIDLRNRILSEKRKRKIDVIIIDFIQRMHNDKYKNDRVREVESISQDLADMARDLDVAVIEFSQLSGASEKLEKDEIPQMIHFKESQAIPENADSIWVLHDTDRGENAFDESGNYKLKNMKIRIDQRYDVSGSIIDILGDLRICEFKDA
jgi:replicative DNA helicase